MGGSDPDLRTLDLSLGIWLDGARGELVGGDGDRTRLGASECRLLERLSSEEGGFVSSVELLDVLWPGDEAKTDNSVQSVVARLRRSIRACGGDPDLIQTGYGSGYRLQAPQSLESGDALGSLDPTPPGRENLVATCRQLVGEGKSLIGLHGEDIEAVLGVARALVSTLEHPPRPSSLEIDLNSATSLRGALRQLEARVGVPVARLQTEAGRRSALGHLLAGRRDLVLLLVGVSPPLLAELEPLLNRLAGCEGGPTVIVTSEQALGSPLTSVEVAALPAGSFSQVARQLLGSSLEDGECALLHAALGGSPEALVRERDLVVRLGLDVVLAVLLEEGRGRFPGCDLSPTARALLAAAAVAPPPARLSDLIAIAWRQEAAPALGEIDRAVAEIGILPWCSIRRSRGAVAIEVDERVRERCVEFAQDPRELMARALRLRVRQVEQARSTRRWGRVELLTGSLRPEPAWGPAVIEFLSKRRREAREHLGLLSG